MMKLILVAAVLSSSFAWADCRPLYIENEQISKQGKKASVTTTLAGVTILALGNAPAELKPVAILNRIIETNLFKIAFLSGIAGSFYFASPDKFHQAKKLIDQSYAGKGDQLSQLATAFGVSDEKLAQKIVSLNESDKFCYHDEGKGAQAAYLSDKSNMLAILEHEDMGPVTRR